MEEQINGFNQNMTDYLVYYQTYNSKTKEWDYKNRIFNTESKAKKFGAQILKVDPNNGIMIRSKEYAIIYEDGFPVKRYMGKERFIVNSTLESHKRLLEEMAEDMLIKFAAQEEQRILMK